MRRKRRRRAVADVIIKGKKKLQDIVMNDKHKMGAGGCYSPCVR